MKPPTSVRLLTQLITVDWVEGLTLPGHGDEDGHPGHKAMGVYQMAEQAIFMDVGLGFERERQTFLHENLHAIVAMGKLEDAFNEGAEEHIVGVLAPFLLGWMRDNPKAVEWLMEVQ